MATATRWRARGYRNIRKFPKQEHRAQSPKMADERRGVPALFESG